MDLFESGGCRYVGHSEVMIGDMLLEGDESIPAEQLKRVIERLIDPEDLELELIVELSGHGPVYLGTTYAADGSRFEIEVTYDGNDEVVPDTFQIVMYQGEEAELVMSGWLIEEKFAPEMFVLIEDQRTEKLDSSRAIGMINRFAGSAAA